MTDLLDDLVEKSHPPRRRWRFGVVGVVLVLLGLAALGWVGWQFVGSGLWAKQQYSSQIRDLQTAWESSPTIEPTAGQAYAILRVPTFGDDYAVPIIHGVETGFLGRGVGAYPSSVEPGDVGNLALAGYRTTHGAPFGKLLDLNAGDEVVIETGEAIYVYVVDVPARDVTVDEAAAWVLDPVPGTTDEPTQPTLTLTTSQDLVHSADRSVAFAHLGSTRNK